MDGRWKPIAEVQCTSITSGNFTVSWHSHGPFSPCTWIIWSLERSPVFMTKSTWLMVNFLFQSCEIPSFDGEIHWNPHRSLEISWLNSPINPQSVTVPGPETVRRLPQSARSLADAEDGKKVVTGCGGSPGLYPWGLREGFFMFFCHVLSLGKWWNRRKFRM